MLGASLVRDRGLGKVLVAAPSAMQIPLQGETSAEARALLEPTWVAGRIVELLSGAFKYKCARILVDPPQLEIIECLDNDMVAICL